MPPKRRSSGRAPTRNRTSSRRSAPVPAPPIEDEESSDLPDDSVAPTPLPDEQEVDDEDEDPQEDPELEDDGTPVADSDQEVASIPRPSASRTRKGGRAGKHVRGTRIEDWGTPEPLGDEPSDAGTPGTPGTPRTTASRGRGRGGFRGHRGGFRGRLKGNRGPSHVTQPPVDKDGNVLDIQDDEVVLPEDPEGEEKIDKNGVLQGDREYRVRTFRIIGREERLYMLSTEPARCTGFRDSYLFFAKHPTLHKIVIDEDQKVDLIGRELIPHSYKGRSIGVVTARSVFREFGCKIVVGGKKIIDDYKVAEARERGDKEGELADPTDAIMAPGRTYNRNQYVAWHGATKVAYSNEHFERLPAPGKSGIITGKRKANLTTANWMIEHAVAASQYNSALVYSRRLTQNGVYNTHTNQMCYPSGTQPTHARWERVPAPPPINPRKRKLDAIEEAKPLVNGTSHLVNGDQSPAPSGIKSAPATDDFDPPSKIFRPLSDVLARNFLIVDTHYETAPASTLPPPGPRTLDGDALTGGSLGAPQLSEAEMDDMELPEECRVALRVARAEEEKWARRWGPEAEFGARGDLRIGIGMGI